MNQDQRRGPDSPSSTRDLDAIRDDIEREFGLVPSFFLLASDEPPIVEGLFGLARLAYLRSPMPPLFKERLFTYLSRFCAIPYCLARHCGFLLGRGRVAGDPEAEPLGIPAALDMLRSPVPDAPQKKRVLDGLRATPGPMDDWPEPESELEELIIQASTLIFLRPLAHAEFLAELRRVLGPRRHQYLMLFLSFIRFAHFWTEIHPELALEADIELLLEEQRALGEWVAHYQEAVREELAERIGTELELLEVMRERASAAEAANVALRRQIDEQTRAAELAEAASRAKSSFLAVMSHELRTPLNAILGYADLLDAEVTGRLTAGQREQLARLQENGKDLVGLVEQVLSFSRIEAGHETIGRAHVDIVRLIRDVASMIEPLGNRKGLNLRLSLPDAPVEVVTDGGKVRQILLNLLSNAVKFTDTGGIAVRLRSEDGAAVIEVADTGPGIPPGDRDRVFRPFEQVDTGTTRSKGGTGLGLSVSAELARLLGGTLHLETEVGRGSTFTLTVPSLERPNA